MEAPSTLPWSFINGYSVPHVLHPKQVAVLFPNGLLGLRQVLPSECGEPVYVYPNEEGSFSLKAGEVYTTSKFVGQDEEVPPSTIPCHISAAVASVLPIAKTINHTGVLGGHLTVSDGSSSELLPRVYACTPNRSPTSEKEPLTAVADCRSPPPMQFFDPVDSAEHINTTHSLSHIAGKSPEMCATTNQKIEPCDGLSQTYRREGKLIQDRVHGHISLPMLAFDIIDTLEYQRLRNIKQLGTTVLLYPGATHTRFEHCIGVAHMASEMVKHFARHQPELEINQADVLCVTIAGLCHDLGHGPFSHLFEHTVGRFAANLQYGASFHSSRYKREARTRWNHEEMSIKLIRRIFERLKANMERSGLTDADRLFIELCVKGLLPIDSWPKNVGRDEKKRFLVEIVANKRHGIDVDKLDYFLRDSLGVYGRPAADIHFPRILSASRVMKYGGQYQICFEVKLALNLGDIFAVRAKLHKYVYQHRIVKVTDYMVSDALCQSTKDFFVRGKDGKEVSLSSCAYDVEGFISLGDWILNAISASTNPKLAVARDIIDRLQRRKLYTIVDDVPFKSETDPRREMMATRMTGERVAKELLDIVEGLLPKRDNNNNNNAAVLQRIEASLIVSFTNITYGSYDVKQVPDDPISKVIFFNPKQMHMGPFKLPAERISPLFQPIAFSDRSMLVLMRDTTHRDLVERACEEWRGKHSDSISVAVPSSNVCSQSKEHSTPQMKRAREPEENDGVLIRGVAPRV